MPPRRSARLAAAAPANPAAAPAAPINVLQKLMDHGNGELLELVADATYAMDLPSALRLRQACTALCGRLAAVRAAAEARRLRWVAELSDMDRLYICDDGRRARTYRFVYRSSVLALSKERALSLNARVCDALATAYDAEYRNPAAPAAASGSSDGGGQGEQGKRPREE